LLAAGIIYSVSLLQNYYTIPTEGVVVLPPVAQFTYSPVRPKPSETVQFTDQSYDSDGTVVSWSWNFGDGGTSAQQNPTHSYTSEGTYSVVLAVTDNDGNTNSTQKTIIVAVAPPTSPGIPRLVAMFTYSRASPRSGEVIQFNDATYSLDEIASWLWNFGDGTTSTLQNPTHIYTSEGVYQPSLKVTDISGYNGTVQVMMEVKTADYTIRQNGAVFEAVNKFGVVAFSDTIATTVIQYGLDQIGGSATSTSRKMVFVEDGTYDLAQPTGGWRKNPDGDTGALWMWKSGVGPFKYITLEGESWNTHLKASNRNPNAIYFMAYDDNPSLGVRIANLQLDGGATPPEHSVWNQKNGIQTLFTHDAIFETLWIHNFDRTGLYNTEFSYRNEIRNNLISYNSRFGCSYTSSHTGHIHHNRFEGNDIWGLNIDSTYGPADNTVAEYNLFINQPLFDVFVISESIDTAVKNAFVRNNIFISSGSMGVIKTTFARENIVIENNYIEWSGPSDQQVIMIQDSSKDIRVLNNYIKSSAAYGAIYIDDGSSCLIKGNNFTMTGGDFVVRIAPGSGNSGTIIENNTFKGLNGVFVGTGVNNTVIRGNDFRQITGTPIENHGTGTIIEDNLMP